MAEMTTSDNSSPSNSALARKNKLGYTRISVACAHCRRRKIRCVTAEGDFEGRCSNCIKLKKECVYTSVDANSNPSSNTSANSEARAVPARTGPGSRTPSAVSSQSPSGVEPECFPLPADDAQSTRAAYPRTTTGLSAPVGMTIGQGMAAGPSDATQEPFTMSRPNVPEWQTHTMGMAQAEYHDQHYAIPWGNPAEHLRAYNPQGYADVPQDMHYPFAGNAHAYANRPPQWTTHEHQPTMDPHTGGIHAYAQGHHALLYNEQYMPVQPGLAQAPVIPSQYLAPAMNPGRELESQQPGWNVYQQVPTVAGPSSRHDSMATNWSRVQSNQGRAAVIEDDQQPRPTRRLKHAKEYPE